MECRLPDVGFGDDSNAVLRREYLAVIVLVAPWSVARFLVLESREGVLEFLAKRGLISINRVPV
jgi:hypothetical protein